MPADILCAVCTYVANNAYDGVGCTVWDGEVHRYDPRGQTVGPESSGGRADWPVIKFSLPDRATGGFTREWTFEDSYHDQGTVICQVWHNTKEQALKTLDMLEALLSTMDYWDAVSDLIPSPYRENPHYVTQMLLKHWTCYQVEGFRTMKGEIVYTAEAYFLTGIHGALPTGLTSSAPNPAFPSTPVLDDFNRANQGPPPSSSWTTADGAGHQVQNNRCVPAGANTTSFWNPRTFNPDQEVYCTLRTLPGNLESVNLPVRHSSSSTLVANGYYASFEVRTASNDMISLIRRTSGTDVQLGATINIGDNYSVGDVLGVRIKGDVIEAYRNGVLLGRRTDGAHRNAGYIGIYTNGAALPQVDDFGGGNL